jgi:acetyl-CoA carboxylase biotin carboxyl carrier protein
MELKEIQELIKILNKSNISEIRIERDNFKITLRTHDPHGSAPVVATVSTAPSIPVAVPVAAPVVAPPVTAPVAEAPKAEAPKAPPADESKYVTIKSPMIGTFYRSSSPDKPPLVNVGDEIKPGTVLCIIEAMKLFNEIESEHSGRIVKVLVENAKPVEYDQPLFLIEPL